MVNGAATRAGRSSPASSRGSAPWWRPSSSTMGSRSPGGSTSPRPSGDGW